MFLMAERSWLNQHLLKGVIGNKFPLNDDGKWPIANNIFIYALILLAPVYLTIFFVF